MITVECVEPNRYICECCGSASTRLTRFVYQNGEAFAVYYALLSKGHSEREIQLVVSLGEWDADEVPDCRVAFSLVMWATESDYNVRAMNADESPWHNIKILGRMLNRDEALVHPWIDDVFHITDHIVEDDAEIKSFFESETIH